MHTIKTEKSVLILVRLLSALTLLYFSNVIYQLQLHEKPGLIFAWLVIFFIFINFFHISIGFIATMGLALVFYGMSLETKPVSDFNAFFDLASNFTNIEKLATSKSFSTTVIQGGILKALGNTYFSAILISTVLCLSGILLMLAGNMVWIRKFQGHKFDISYRFIIYLPLFYFSLWLYSPVFSSESVGIFLIGLLWFTIISRPPTELSSLLIGLLLALLFLCRSNLLLFGFLVPLIWHNDRHFSQSPKFGLPLILRHAILMLLSFSIVVTAYGTFSYLSGFGFKIQSSPYGTLNLMLGANQSTDGGWNKDDAQKVSTGDPVHPIDNQLALHTAIARIGENPLGFMSFALSRKIKRLWGSYYSWAFGNSEAAKLKIAYIGETFQFLHLGGIAIFLLAIIFGAFFTLVRPVSYVLWPLLLMTGLWFLHIFIEVQGRYQIPIVLSGFLFLATLAHRCPVKVIAKP